MTKGTISMMGIVDVRMRVERSKNRIEEYRGRILRGLEGIAPKDIQADNLMLQIQGIIEEQAKLKENEKFLSLITPDEN